MQQTQAPIGIDEYEAAALLGLSVWTLRKDRCGERRIPYFQIGKSVRYNPDRLRETATAYELGGLPKARPARRAVTAR
jgi:hypothetical protein